MTVGDFINQLKNKVHEEDYTCNNVSILNIEQLNNCFKVGIIPNSFTSLDDAIEFYIE